MASRIDANIPAPFDLPPLPQVVNHTPWPAQNFLHVDPQGDVFHVMVCRTTYSLRGMRYAPDTLAQPLLLPSSAQPPLLTQDRYRAAINASSTVQESDFAPYKPLCDVLVVNATAHAPGGRATQRWNVGLRVGTLLHKRLTVTGPRTMRPPLLGGAWQVDKPHAVTQVPLGYELAFGGPNLLYAQQSADMTVRIDAQPSDADRGAPSAATASLLSFYNPNPIGTGRTGGRETLEWIKRQCDLRQQQCQAGQADPLDPVQRAWANITEQGLYRAPQIEKEGQPFDGSQRDYPVLGLGPLARWWSPRQALAGTHDDTWKAVQWPKSPLDHDYRYWNCAPEDQQIPYPEGGEEVALEHLTPSAPDQTGTVRFALPRQDLSLLARLQAGPLLLLPLVIDTVVIDLQEATLALVRRALWPADLAVRQFELGTWSARDPLARNALGLPTAQLASKTPRGSTQP